MRSWRAACAGVMIAEGCGSSRGGEDPPGAAEPVDADADPRDDEVDQEPVDLGIFEPAVPEGALQLVEAQAFEVLEGEFAAYGVVLNSSVESQCFVNVTLDLESNSGLPLGGWPESTWSTVRRIDQDNTVGCIEPGQTGWFYAWDWENEHRFEDVGTVRYTFDSMPLTTFDPSTEVVVLPNQVDITEGESSFGAPQIDIVANAKNRGQANATFGGFGEPFVGFVLLFAADGRFIDRASCYAEDGTLSAGQVAPIVCDALGAEFPDEVVFSLVWAD